MPGYLSQLAARALGSRPAVRPRITSLFEAAPGIAGAGELFAGGLRVIEEERVVPQPAAPSRATAFIPTDTPRAAHTTTAPAAPSRHSDVPTHRESHRLEAVEIAHESALPPADRREPRRKMIASLDPEPAPPRRATARTEHHATDAVDEAGTLQTRPARHVSELPTESLRPAKAEPAERVPQRAQPVELRIAAIRPAQEPPPAPAPPNVSPALAVAPHSELRPVQQFPARAEPEGHEAPSIQVTIGRLIVEAVAPAPAAAPPLPASRARGPQLSLDDYLRQRRSQA